MRTVGTLAVFFLCVGTVFGQTNKGGISVTVEVEGFKKAVVDNVKVDTATTATVNVTLQAGTVEDVVNVTAGDALVLNRESGTAGQTISERQIVEMPLNNRSV